MASSVGPIKLCNQELPVQEKGQGEAVVPASRCPIAREAVWNTRSRPYSSVILDWYSHRVHHSGELGVSDYMRYQPVDGAYRMVELLDENQHALTASIFSVAPDLHGHRAHDPAWAVLHRWLHVSHMVGMLIKTVYITSETWTCRFSAT